MATTRQEKEAQFKELVEDLGGAKGVVFAQYRGLTVKEIDQIRKSLRKENVKYRVVKLTLLRKALAELGIDAQGLNPEAPIALVVSQEDETVPARLVKSLGKDFKSLLLDGGVMEKRLLDKQAVTVLADLPSKQQLLGQLVSVIAGPARGLVTVLSGNMRQLVYALNAIADAKK